MIVGFLACVIASICLGSVFVPIKNFEPSDGFMGQFFMGVGGILVGLATQALLDFPPIYPVVMVGGALWCFANAFAIMIMNRLGMSKSILIWSTVSCVTGWATSRFGLFGPASIPNSILLNYIGLGLLIAGGFVYPFIKNNLSPRKDSEEIGMEDSTKKSNEQCQQEEIPKIERILAYGGATISGLFYGSMCTPVSYVQNNPMVYPNAPSDGLPYLFSFFCGVLPMSAAILVIYSLCRKNSPSMPPNLVIPSIFSGILFGIGMGGFFVGNEKLSQTIAYPICSFAPAVVVNAWSVLHFKEITGSRNLIFLGIAYAFTLSGVAIVTISKDI